MINFETLLKSACFNPDLFGKDSGWKGHLPFAYWLIGELRPNTFVELGSHWGHSYFAFCQAVKETNKHTACYSVDTWQGEEHAGFYGEEVFSHVNLHNQSHYAQFSHLLRMTFDEAVNNFSDQSIDLLHIDGLHTYQAIRHDFETWLPKLSSGAVVLFHDIHVREKGFGVWKFWEEICYHYPRHLAFRHSHGLGVIQVGDHDNEEKREWLNPNSPMQELFRDFFYALGTRQAERLELQRFRGDFQSTQRILAERVGDIGRLEVATAEREVQVAELESAIVEQEGQIAELESTVAEQEGQLSLLNQALNGCEDQNAWLNEAINEIYGTLSWKITRPLRSIRRLFSDNLSPTSIKDSASLNSENSGLNSVSEKSAMASACSPPEEALDHKPKISAVMSCGDSVFDEILETVNSVRLQTYQNWELILVSKENLNSYRHYFDELSGDDPRIRLVEENSLGTEVINLHQEICLATGEYFAKLHPGKILHQTAFWQLAKLINKNPVANIVFACDKELDDSEPELEPLVNYLKAEGVNAEGNRDLVIRKIKKTICYWRSHGPKETCLMVLLKIIAKGQKLEQTLKDAQSERAVGAGLRSPLHYRIGGTTPLITYSLPETQVRRINMVTDSINSGSLFGGVGTAIIFSALLANKLGASLRIVTRTEPPIPSNVDHVLSLYGVKLDKEMQFKFAAFYDHAYELDFAKDDLFITTSWWTTAAALPSVPSSSIIYLLQEDERMFYAFGDERFQCDKILKNREIRFVINTKLLFDHLIQSGLDNISARGLWFEPAFPCLIYYPRGKPEGGKLKFFFYARPNNQRNLYHFGMEVIEHAIDRGILDLKQWDICLVGKDIPEVTFNCGYVPQRLENLSWMDYAQLVGTIDLGFSLMYTPHPSYPPLDLAASGAVVVTNSFGIKQDLSGYSPNLLCADLDREFLIMAIEKAVEIVLDPERRKENFRRNGLSTDWRASLTPIIDQLSGGGDVSH